MPTILLRFDGSGTGAITLQQDEVCCLVYFGYSVLFVLDRVLMFSIYTLRCPQEEEEAYEALSLLDVQNNFN